MFLLFRLDGLMNLQSVLPIAGVLKILLLAEATGQ